MKFEELKFSAAGNGKGKWEVSFGGMTEKIKYTSQGYLTEKADLAYCLIEREDGQKIHVFFSILEDHSEILTTTGAVTKQMEIGKVLLNSLHPKEDRESHLNSHLACLSGKKMKLDPDQMKKQLKDLPDKVYEIGKMAILKSMGI